MLNKKLNSDEIINKFKELGITEMENINTILTGFENLAEIGYTWYIKNNNKNTINNDKEA